METKICKKCNEELTIDRFSISKKGNKEYIRNVCKSCLNKQRSNKETIKKAEKGNDSLSNIFTETEIGTLKNLIEVYPVIQDFKNNKIILEKSVNKKSIRTINLEDSIHKIIKDKSKETNLSISDIVNTLLKKAIEYL